jgi:hypothetical protein
MLRVIALASAFVGASASAPSWSWDRVQTFVHCSNSSGPLNDQIVQLMAQSSFAVIEKYQDLAGLPWGTGAEDKQIAAARAIRAVNPNASVVLYFAVDYTRTWFNLGRYFDAHPELEVHNSDGSLATVKGDGNYTWHIFDFAVPLAQEAWVWDVATTVNAADYNGNRLFDGVFIDGYRSPSSWASNLIGGATAAEQTAWLAGVNATGALLAAALGDDVIRIMNPGQLINDYQGYNAVSIEFFDSSLNSVQSLQQLGAEGAFVEVHTYAGSNVALFNASLAAYLCGVEEGSYFGAGAQWDMCDDWMIPHPEYSKALGAPDGPAVLATTAQVRMSQQTGENR